MRRWWLWLALILALGTTLRLWVWHDHGIDPDEGAHLMDARLVLRGMIPYVDFTPRGIVYTYIVAGLIRLLGADYHYVRLGVVLVEPIIMALVFLIARRLFDDRTALVAAATYALFPFAVLSSTIVHMEPFAILSACGIAYFLLRHVEPGGGWAALLGAGMLATLGIYIRESGLPVAAAAVLTLVLCSWRMPALLLRRLGVFLAGALIPCVVIGLAFYGRLSLGAWWATELNPLSGVLRHIHPVSVGSGPSPSGLPGASGPTQVAVDIHRAHPQDWAVTWHGFGKTLIAFGPLLVALVLGAVLILSLRDEGESRRVRVAGAVLYPWACVLGLAYVYWTLYRGFFPEYSVELLPPLVIIFAFVLLDFLGRARNPGLIAGAMLILTAASLTISLAFPPTTAEVPRFLYVAVPPLVLGRVWSSWPERGQWWWLVAAVVGLAILVVPLDLPLSLHRALKLAAAVGLVVAGWVAVRSQIDSDRPTGLFDYLGRVALGGAIGLALDVSCHSPGLRFDGVWPQAVVREIADALRGRGQPGDEVVSGAVIWEFQADREPFERITHPLKFEFGIAATESEALTARLERRPPRFVVLDGYTERTYLAVLPGLSDLLRDRYDLVETARGGVYPVRLFELREGRP